MHPTGESEVAVSPSEDFGVWRDPAGEFGETV